MVGDRYVHFRGLRLNWGYRIQFVIESVCRGVFWERRERLIEEQRTNSKAAPPRGHEYGANLHRFGLRSEDC